MRSIGMSQNNGDYALFERYDSRSHLLAELSPLAVAQAAKGT